jgi:hypothetical protein
VVLVLCILASASGVVFAWQAARPINLFRRQVLSPAPASLTDLRIAKYTSFGDGSAWVFAFRVSPQDFEAIRLRHQIRQTPVDLEARRKELGEVLVGGESAGDVRRITDQIFPEDAKLAYTGLYVRPSDPEFYTGDRLTLVTNRSHTIVYMYFDRHRLSGRQGG